MVTNIKMPLLLNFSENVSLVAIIRSRTGVITTYVSILQLHVIESPMLPYSG